MATKLLLYNEILEEIKKGIIKEGTYSENCIGSTFYTARAGKEAYISSKKKKDLIDIENPLLIKPGEFVLLTTLEHFKIPSDISCQIGFKSSVIRKGLIPLAGKTIAPGFEGVLVLGFFNSSPREHFFHYGDELCKIEFFKLHANVPERLLEKVYEDQKNGYIPKEDIAYLLSYKPIDLSEIAKRLDSLENTNKLVIGGAVVALLAFIASKILEYLLK